jgi:hypothetical protein
MIVGASSAFDITGRRMLESDLLGADSAGTLYPPDRVATDFARVMRSFGRSAWWTMQALAAGDDTQNGRKSAQSDGARVVRCLRDRG